MSRDPTRGVPVTAVRRLSSSSTWRTTFGSRGERLALVREDQQEATISGDVEARARPASR